MKVVERDTKFARLTCGHVVRNIPVEKMKRLGLTGLRCLACREQVAPNSFAAKRFESLAAFYVARGRVDV